MENPVPEHIFVEVIVETKNKQKNNVEVANVSRESTDSEDGINATMQTSESEQKSTHVERSNESKTIIELDEKITVEAEEIIVSSIEQTSEIEQKTTHVGRSNESKTIREPVTQDEAEEMDVPDLEQTSEFEQKAIQVEKSNETKPTMQDENEITVEAEDIAVTGVEVPEVIEEYQPITVAWVKTYKSLRKRLSAFANITSIQPFINIRNAKSIFDRLSWFLIAIVVWSVVLLGVSEITTKYFSLPTEDSLYNREELITFPSVTLCPVVPVIFDEQEWSESAGDFIFQLHSDKIKKYYENNKSISENLIAPIINRIITKERFLDLAEDQISRRTYNDLILECNFNGEVCDETNFINVTVGSYGNCFTFQTKSIERFHVREVGPDFGLRLILFLNSYSPMDELNRYDFRFELNEFDSNFATISDGIRLAIHAPGTMPDTDVEGLDLSPGMFTSIGLSQDVRTLQRPPYGQCALTEQYNKDTTYNYTMDLCLRQCQQEHMIKKCGCLTYNGPVPPNTNLTKTPYCGRKVNSIYRKMIDKWLEANRFVAIDYEWDNVIRWNDFNEILEAIDCEKNVAKMVSRGEETCGCKKQCIDITYDPLVHAVPWPNEKYYKGINRRNFIRFLRQQPKTAPILDNNLFHTGMDSSFYQGIFCDVLKPINKYNPKFDKYREPHMYWTDEWPYLDCTVGLKNLSMLYDYEYWDWYYYIFDGDPTINKYAVVNKIIQKNFLKVNIYYRSLTVNRIAEEPSYPLNKFLSELGGIIGMYAGMSAVSLIELASILVTLLFVLYKHTCRK